MVVYHELNRVASNKERRFSNCWRIAVVVGRTGQDPGSQRSTVSHSSRSQNQISHIRISSTRTEFRFTHFGLENYLYLTWRRHKRLSRLRESTHYTVAILEGGRKETRGSLARRAAFAGQLPTSKVSHCDNVVNIEPGLYLKLLPLTIKAIAWRWQTPTRSGTMGEATACAVVPRLVLNLLIT